MGVYIGTDDNDTLRGTDGIDHVIGNGGDDTLYGRGGDDIVAGGLGDDLLIGGPGRDTLKGDNHNFGNDKLWGGIYGGNGDGERDIFDMLGAGHDTIFDFEPGIDKIALYGSYSRANPPSWTYDDTHGGTVVHLSESSSIVLVGVRPEQIDVYDFYFRPASW